jgi:cation diffusion facilitator family transporter
MKEGADISPAPGMRERQEVMLASIAAEWGSFGLNLVGALMANSVTLWANTLRVGLDAAATLFAWLVTRRISHGKAHQFDYGLGKWENLSAFFNAAVMLTAMVFIVFRAIMRFLDPKPVTGAGFGVSVLLFFTVVNLWLLVRFWRLRRTDSSPVVEAQMVLYRNASAASLISLTAVQVSWLAGKNEWAVWFDPIGAMVLCGVIFFGMITLFQKSLPAMLDQTLDESLQLRILRGLAECFEDYSQVHAIRTRRSGNRVFVELFLEFEPAQSVREMLSRAGRLKSLVENMIPNAEVWVIPCGSSEVPGPARK